MEEVGATVASTTCDSLPLQPMELLVGRPRTKAVADQRRGFMLLVDA
jgi:hypothetical protein